MQGTLRVLPFGPSSRTKETTVTFTMTNLHQTTLRLYSSFRRNKREDFKTCVLTKIVVTTLEIKTTVKTRGTGNLEKHNICLSSRSGLPPFIIPGT